MITSAPPISRLPTVECGGLHDIAGEHGERTEEPHRLPEEFEQRRWLGAVRFGAMRRAIDRLIHAIELAQRRSE